MTVGKDSWKGLGVPLHGDFEITQKTAATDMMTLTGASGQAGDFIVCRNSSGTELFVVDSSGNINLSSGSIDVSAGNLIIQLEQFTTAPSTGLTTGQLFSYTAGNAHYLGLATAAGTLVEVLLN